MEAERYLTDRERLGAALRDLRLAAGMTGAHAADRTGMSQPKISKLENSRLLPSARDVRTLAALYGAKAAERDELLDIADRLHAAIESSRTILRRGTARQQAQLGEIEAQAAILRCFSPLAIPDLLQTCEYMRRVFALGLSGAGLARAIAARQQRQQLLYDPGKQFTFVVTEAALRWRFCPDDVMAVQAGHIASVATLTNVDVGLIPFTARPADIPLHGYEIFDDRLASVGLEHAAVSVNDPRDIAMYARLFATIAEAAEFGDAARDRLAAIARELQHMT
jgi:transcriptional regulator with XRE-family HTH domain